MGEPLNRQAFERSRATAAMVTRRDSRRLAGFSVTVGVLQLIFLSWADAHLERGPKLTIALTAFVIYLIVVAGLMWRMERNKRLAGPTCPQCGIRLTGLSERVAAATGRCDSCGGLVLDGEPAGQPRVTGT